MGIASFIPSHGICQIINADTHSVVNKKKSIPLGAQPFIMSRDIPRSIGEISNGCPTH